MFGYEWDFEGDGTFDVTGQVTTHTYDRPGIFQATLRVTDTGGLYGTASIPISVTRTVVGTERPFSAAGSALGKSAPKSADGSSTIADNTIADGILGRVSAVVADIGPGTNPYHEVFRRPDWTEHPCEVIPGLPCDMPALQLTFGDDYHGSLNADLARGVWSGYGSRPGVVHWVPGTNLLLLTLRSFYGNPHDGYGGPGARGVHGLATAGAMANGCPDCYVLVVQDSNSIDGEPLRHITEHLPWVDFVASTNFPGYDDGTYDRHARASFALAETGRYFFASSGNAFVTPLTGGQSPGIFMAGRVLPPWVILVGGALKRVTLPSGHFEDCNAVSVRASKPAEFAGDFTQYLPAVETVNGYGIFSGTSLSAPQIAARFTHALLQVRQRLGDSRAPGALWAGLPRATPYLEDGRLTAAEMREVLSRTAQLFSTAEADASCMAETLLETTSPYVPASPTPWVDMGWGYVDTPDADLAAAVISGEAALPQKPEAAEAYMGAFMATRHAAYPDAPADHDCNGIVTPLDTPAGTFYIDVRPFEPALYIYQEYNGEPGLQSGGEDRCSHDNPDA